MNQIYTRKTIYDKNPPFVTKKQTNLGGKKNKHCLDSIYVALF